MFSYHLNRRSLRRFIRPILEELECRHVPSLLGVQITLPVFGMLSVDVGAPQASGATSTPAATVTPGTSTSSALGPVTLSFEDNAPGSNPFSLPTAASTAGASQQPALASNGSGPSATSASSSPAIANGVGQGSEGSAIVPSVTPAAAAAGLGIQAAQAGESTVLGGAVGNIGFELLGNLPSLLGPGNVFSGATNASLSSATSGGASTGGSVLGRPKLSTDQGIESGAAFGLTQPSPSEESEPFPEKPPSPPDENWWLSTPQAVEQVPPPGISLLPEQSYLQASDRGISPEQALPDGPQIFDGLPEGVLFDEEGAQTPADEDQPEEQSSISAAVALVSCGAGIYWTTRNRGLRRAAVVLPLGIEEIEE